jgi:hypothetical protein
MPTVSFRPVLVNVQSCHTSWHSEITGDANISENLKCYQKTQCAGEIVGLKEKRPRSCRVRELMVFLCRASAAHSDAAPSAAFALV